MQMLPAVYKLASNVMEYKRRTAILGDNLYLLLRRFDVFCVLDPGHSITAKAFRTISKLFRLLFRKFKDAGNNRLLEFYFRLTCLLEIKLLTPRDSGIDSQYNL